MPSTDTDTSRTVAVLCWLIIAGCAVIAVRCLGRLAVLGITTFILRWERANYTPDRTRTGAANIDRCLRLRARSFVGLAWDLALLVVLWAALVIASRLL